MTAAADAHTLVQLFEHAVRTNPNGTAVEDSGDGTITWSEFDALTNRVAAALHANGVKRGDRVGISMPKSINSFACVIGAMKAGAAYVPTDYSAPAERNRYIFENCETTVVCVDEPRAQSIFSESDNTPPLLLFPGEATDGIGSPEIDALDAEWSNDNPAQHDDLAYILYTSGSTGLPKGVMHSHDSALSFVHWGEETLEPKSTDRFSSHAPFHFDLSILDLYVPMTAAATIVIVSEGLGKEPQTLAEFIAARAITCWYSVPSILAMMAEYGHMERHDYSSLRSVCFAGEVFPVKHLRALKQQWPSPAYHNLYGPTETNVCTFYTLPESIDDHRTAPFPIGPACSNVRALVLDDDHNPVAKGDEGLLFIHYSGPTMLGYWNLPERTESATWVDPDGEKWYATGDVVSEDGNGDFIFVGRRDRMVKRRGYRIELGEVEAGLYRHPDVREIAAIATSNDEGVTVTAFLSPNEDAKLSIIALKGYSMKNLISYMVPDRFVILEELPRTSTDKVDYQALKKSLMQEA